MTNADWDDSSDGSAWLDFGRLMVADLVLRSQTEPAEIRSWKEGMTLTGTVVIKRLTEISISRSLGLKLWRRGQTTLRMHDKTGVMITSRKPDDLDQYCERIVARLSDQA